jgi:N-acyl-D-amino-acid deacylase
VLETRWTLCFGVGYHSRAMVDLKIVGGLVVDGTGAPAARADVGIAGDTIIALGDLAREPAGRTIDASGLVVAPGFIDVHTHSDWRLWANRRAESKIRQGVTTEVVGNCGFSPAPVSDEFRASRCCRSRRPCTR